jgi:DUF971 family protein
MARTPEPIRLELQRPNKRLLIAWDDGHESTYSLRYLRGFCPCAHCQGHSKRGWTFQPVEDPQITRIEETGHYAVTISYSDGHDTGIYSYDILRELCPCDACRKQWGGAHAMSALPPGEVV